jgi:hypothetical protein
MSRFSPNLPAAACYYWPEDLPMPAGMNIFDIDDMIEHHRLRERLPKFRKIVADMANMADGDVAAFDEATEGFMKGRPGDFHKAAVDRLFRLWFRHYRREVVRRGDEKRCIEMADRC